MQVRSANWSTMRRFLHQNPPHLQGSGSAAARSNTVPRHMAHQPAAPVGSRCRHRPRPPESLIYCTSSLHWMAADVQGTKDPHLPARGWTALRSWMTAAGCCWESARCGQGFPGTAGSNGRTTAGPPGGAAAAPTRSPPRSHGNYRHGRVHGRRGSTRTGRVSAGRGSPSRECSERGSGTACRSASGKTRRPAARPGGTPGATAPRGHRLIRRPPCRPQALWAGFAFDFLRHAARSAQEVCAGGAGDLLEHG